jgi:hypothetical protein
MKQIASIRWGEVETNYTGQYFKFGCPAVRISVGLHSDKQVTFVKYRNYVTTSTCKINLLHLIRYRYPFVIATVPFTVPRYRYFKFNELVISYYKSN